MLTFTTALSIALMILSADASADEDFGDARQLRVSIHSADLPQTDEQTLDKDVDKNRDKDMDKNKDKNMDKNMDKNVDKNVGTNEKSDEKPDYLFWIYIFLIWLYVCKAASFHASIRRRVIRWNEERNIPGKSTNSRLEEVGTCR